MRARSLVLAALGAVFVLGAAAPAFADRDDWRRHEWREHREHEWREHRGWDRGYYAPPVYYAPPTYYAPPPVYYNPGVSFGFTVR